MKFSIRDLLWLTALVAVVAGWWVDRSRVQARLTQELEWRATLLPADAAPGKNYWVERDYDLPVSSVPAPRPPKP